MSNEVKVSADGAPGPTVTPPTQPKKIVVDMAEGRVTVAIQAGPAGFRLAVLNRESFVRFGIDTIDSREVQALRDALSDALVAMAEVPR